MKLSKRQTDKLNKFLCGSGFQIRLTKTKGFSLYNETGDCLKKYFLSYDLLRCYLLDNGISFAGLQKV